MKRKTARRSRSWLALLLLSLALAAVLAACSEPRPARFPHRAHLAQLPCDQPDKAACLTCNTCHAVSHTERELKLPSGSLCDQCHRKDRARIHATLGLKPPRPHGKIAIDHARHLAMPEIQGQCVKCHAGVVRDGEADLPPMSQCFTCHEHEQQWQRAECGPCHQAADLRKTQPETFLKHDAAFLRRHGDVLAFEQSLCQTCHEQRDCQACHDVTQDLRVELRALERVNAGFVHRADFITRHAIEAQAGAARCLTCHSTQSCDSCHALRGVSANLLDARNVHPPGWVGNSASVRSLHGTEARRDIVACAACHDQGPSTNCIRCHQVGAYGGNPHPAGWRSSRSEDAEMCRYCHG